MAQSSYASGAVFAGTVSRLDEQFSPPRCGTLGGGSSLEAQRTPARLTTAPAGFEVGAPPATPPSTATGGRSLVAGKLAAVSKGTAMAAAKGIARVGGMAAGAAAAAATSMPTANGTMHTAESQRHLTRLRTRLDQLATQSKGDLPNTKSLTLIAFGEHVPSLTITHTLEFFDECRVKMAQPYGQWQYVRVERHAHNQVWTGMVGFGRTATYAAVFQLLQERLVDKYVEKLQRKGRYATLVEAQYATNEQLDRIMPYLDFKACRATPLSYTRGHVRTEALKERVRAATEAIKHRSQQGPPGAAHT